MGQRYHVDSMAFGGPKRPKNGSKRPVDDGEIDELKNLETVRIPCPVLPLISQV